MGNLKIDNLVDRQSIEDIKLLDTEISNLKKTYTDACKEMSEGIKMKIDGIEDLERLNKVVTDNAKKSEEATEKVNENAEKRKKIVEQTTATISRELAEMEKENKVKRESYSQDEKALKIARDILGTRKQNTRQLAIISADLKKNAAAQKELNDREKDGSISTSELISKRAALIEEEQRLKTAKSELNKVISNEEKMAQAAKGSYKQLSLQLEILKKAYKELNEEEKSGSNGKLLGEEISRLDAHLKDLSGDMGEFQRNVGNYAIAQGQYASTIQEKMFALVGINNELGSSITSLGEEGGKGFTKLKDKVSAFGSALVGLLKNPKVVALLGIGGTAVLFKWLYDYNKNISQATRLTQQFTNAQGSQLNEQRANVQTLADHYGKDFKETLEAINAVSKQFGISFEESFKHVKDGFLSGADVNGEFIDNLKEYPAYFHEAGISASEFIAITTQANQSGIYSDKGIDIIKEANLRIREMTSSTEEAMKGIGMDTDKIKSELEAGLISTFDVVQMVSKQLATLPPASAAVGTAIADIFGGPGEDAGLRYILTLKDVETNLDTVKGKAGELATLEEQQLNAELELQKAIAKVFDLTNGTFEELTTKIKVGLMKALTGLLNAFSSLTKFVKENKGVLTLLGATLLTITSYVKAHSIAVGLMAAKTFIATNATKLFNAVVAMGKPLVLLFSAAFYFLTGSINKATISMRAFNLAVKSNPIGLALTAVTTIIAALVAFSAKADDAKESADGLNREMSNVDRINKRVAESSQKEIYRVKRLAEIVNDSAASYEKKKDALLELQRVVPNFHAALGTELTLTNENIAAVGKYIKQLENKATAEAYYEEIVENKKRIFEAKKKEDQTKEKLNAIAKEMADNPEKYKSNVVEEWVGGGYGPGFTNKVEKNKVLSAKLEEQRLLVEQWRKDFLEVENAQKELQDTMKRMDADQEVTGYFDDLIIGGGTDGGGDNGAADYRKKIIEALKQSDIDLMDEGYEKAIMAMNAAHEKKMAEIKGNSEEEQQLRMNLTEIHNKELAAYETAYNESRARLDLHNRLSNAEEGSQQELDLKLQLLEIDRAAELRTAESTGADKMLINLKYDEQIEQMKSDFTAKRLAKIQEDYAVEASLADIHYVQEQNALLQAYAQGKMSKEDYEREKAMIAEKYSVDSAQRSIDMIEAQLSEENLTAKERKNLEIELAKAKNALEKQMADNMISETERQKKADDDATKKRIENLNRAGEAINAIGELGNAIFESKISHIEEEQQKNDEAKDEEIQRIEDLEESGAITKEEAESRKRAAEEKTKKKNEELEKEKKKAQYKQAIWNKMTQLAQTGIATARGIMEAFAQTGPIAGAPLAAMIAALGAVQAATIIATPIPKYAKGTGSHPGGPAIVGDGGKQEMVVMNGNAWITPDSPTLVNLPKGAEVYPDAELFEAVNALQSVRLDGSGSNPSSVVVNNDFRSLERGQEKILKAMGAFMKMNKRIADRAEFNEYKSDRLL